SVISRETSAACFGATKQRTKMLSRVIRLVVVCMVSPPPEKRTGTTMGIGSMKGSEQYRNLAQEVHAQGVGGAPHRYHPHSFPARLAQRGGEIGVDAAVGRDGAHIAPLGAEDHRAAPAAAGEPGQQSQVAHAAQGWRVGKERNAVQG